MSGPKVPEPFQDIAAELKAQGWTAERRGTGHLAWTSPAGETVISAASPGDRRAKAAFVSQLRQAGAVIDGRATTRGNGSPAPVAEPEAAEDRPEPGPAPAIPEAAALRELVSECRVLLGEMRAERKEIERLLTADAADLITSEIIAEFERMDLKSLAEATIKALHANNERELNAFTVEANKVIRKFDRAMDSRIAEANEDIIALKVVREVWEKAVQNGDGIPPAFRPRFK